MRAKKQITLFAFFFLMLAGSAQAEYAYDCKVDWVCSGPNMCEKSEMEFSLALSGDVLYFEYIQKDVEDGIALNLIDGDINDWSVFSGLDSDGNLTVMSLDSRGNAQISTHRKPRGNNIFAASDRILTSYLTCIWRP